MIWFYAMIITCFYLQNGHGQEACQSQRELQSSFQQVHKLLSAHQLSYLQSLRTLKKKLSLLQNSTVGHSPTTCPPPESPLHGRRLGTVFAVGHQVHFLCNPGYELLGPETRVCQESRSWSGHQPLCRTLTTNTTASPPPPSAPSAFIHPSRCIQFQGSTHCTCEAGYTISGRDSNLCTDIDECELYPLSQPGRLCLHTCVNTPGSFQCVCPPGYVLTRDGRNCKDIDECEITAHNCTQEQLCVNTFGGFQCVLVDCPRIRNATYMKTSPMRCERNPCLVGDTACSRAPNSVSFHYLAVASNMGAPRVLFRVSAARLLGDMLRFSLLGSRGRRHFSVQRSGRQSGQLLLVKAVEGPAVLEAEVEMSELERRTLLGRYITRVTVFVSPYGF